MASTGEPVPAVDHTDSPPNDEEEDREALLAGARAPCQAAPPKRFSDLPERRLKVASRMLKRPGTIHRIMWGWLFRRVAFDERHIDRLHEAHRTGDVVLVMHHHSLLDYLYFNYAFLRFGLPLSTSRTTSPCSGSSRLGSWSSPCSAGSFADALRA